MRVLVTGASGYVGSSLVPRLLISGYDVVAVDTFWFGDHLSNHANLRKFQGDVRHPKKEWFDSIDAVIHLAGVANDPLFHLHPAVSWEIGCFGTNELLRLSEQAGVSKFVFASSGSVYGVRQEEKVTEETPLTPISLYNKVKILTERIVQSYVNSFKYVIVRPATICGPSPRMRLDLAVNALVSSAVLKGEIQLDGGEQIRPHITITDMCRVYEYCLSNIDESTIINAGFENLSMLELAERISKITQSSIVKNNMLDIRSYRLNSDKLLGLGFLPQSDLNQMIDELIDGFKNGQVKEKSEWYSTVFLSKILKQLE